MPLSIADKFRRSVLETIRWRELVTENSSILIAVSGGADSTALLYVLHSLIEKMTLRIAAVHIHHGLRGEDADRDMDAVQTLAGELGISCYVEHIDLTPVVEGSGNVEDAARTERYRAIADIARREGFDCAATAHTKSDQAETVLHRITRSAGPGGMQGVRPSIVLHGVRFIRPLLDRSRADVTAYLTALDRTWREDLTNADVHYARNRIRHNILSELRIINEDVETALSRLADISAADESFFENYVQEIIRTIAVNIDGEWEMDLERMRELPDAARWRFWRMLTGRMAGERTGTHARILVNFEQLRQLDRLVFSQEGRAEVQLRCGLVARRIRRTIKLAYSRQDP